ncbi:Protein TPR3 [Zea mays]|uniref:Protein TPR3 n=1 Tax=Zea mays TaxID=4577 RepID=A0A3L6G9C4_MAIZE|nr:Protein TPR3 [Zea mays]
MLSVFRDLNPDEMVARNTPRDGNGIVSSQSLHNFFFLLIVDACKKATGVDIKIEYLNRRTGDYAESPDRHHLMPKANKLLKNKLYFPEGDVNLPVNMLPVTYPQSHNYQQNNFHKTVARTLSQGSTPMNMDFHPLQQTLLLDIERPSKQDIYNTVSVPLSLRLMDLTRGRDSDKEEAKVEHHNLAGGFLWFIFLSLVATGITGYVPYKYRARRYTDSEICAIMAHYMPCTTKERSKSILITLRCEAVGHRL